ncbi:MAG: hypothetical protein ACI4DO_03985 [Roseburia sp.]
MTLLIVIFAAAAVTVIWYASEKARKMKIGVLCYLFWGASLMWLVDAVVEYLKLGAAFFNPEAADMLNDTFLGLAVVALALIIWIVILLVKDPDGVIHSIMTK